MADIKQFTQRLKFVKSSDIKAIPSMCIGFLASLPFRMMHKNIWLICERENEARDNGYWFYKYMCENHSEIEAVYAINREGIDYNKVANIGKVIQFGSIRHWMYYFAAKKNISSQKEGKPNAALCYILEVYLGARKNRIYLKHGIIKDAQRWIYYDVSKLSMMCCAAEREQRFIQDNFGYSKDDIKLVGLCRFDNLLAPHKIKRQILIMPTMREWLRTISSDTLKYEQTNNFCESEYYITWSGLLNNKKLHVLLDYYDVNLVFYPHPAMQKYLTDFKTGNNHVIIAPENKYDMQQLLMESAMLITDYSSIYFDFAYMRKPLVYYQFDYEKYRKGQYQEGYFSYIEDGFGPVITKEYQLLEEIERVINNEFKIEKKYQSKVDSFFAFFDQDNCKRTYEAIIEEDTRGKYNEW